MGKVTFTKKQNDLMRLFKQKTAYEIYSRDWSSDVCSSDLKIVCERRAHFRG